MYVKSSYLSTRSWYVLYKLLTSSMPFSFFFSCYGDHRVLHVLTHSCPTRRSSELWGQAEGQVWRSFSGIGVTGLSSELPAYYLAGVFAVPELRPLGSIRVDIHAAELRDHMLVVLDGDAVWADAAVAGQANADFGTLRAHVGLDAPNSATLTLDDDGGPLDLAGQLWLSPLGFSGDVSLHARDPQLQPAQIGRTHV